MRIHDFNDDRGTATGSEPEMRSVNHRGYSAIAPENTLPAYRLSKEMGFRYVETDVSFTADGVPVLLHDATIDRTSNGSGKIAEMTLEQARKYDFGSWKSPDYTGTIIPTLEEFLKLCRDLELYPYIELKKNGKYTRTQIESIINLVIRCGMKKKTAYISFSPKYLIYVRNYDPSARLGYLRSTASQEDIDICRNLKTSFNRVFYDVKYTTITHEICYAFAKAKIPVEAWTVNKVNSILNMHPYVSGITSDSQIAGNVLKENGKGRIFEENTENSSLWRHLRSWFPRLLR